MCPRRSFYLGRRPEQQCLRYVERGWCLRVSDNAATFAEKLDALLVLVVNATQVKQVLFGEKGVAQHLKPGTAVMVFPLSPVLMRKKLLPLWLDSVWKCWMRRFLVVR